MPSVYQGKHYDKITRITIRNKFNFNYPWRLKAAWFVLIGWSYIQSEQNSLCTCELDCRKKCAKDHMTTVKMNLLKSRKNTYSKPKN